MVQAYGLKGACFWESVGARMHANVRTFKSPKAQPEVVQFGLMGGFDEVELKHGGCPLSRLRHTEHSHVLVGTVAMGRS